eukprot:96597-Rhodomonas_salina.1
MEVLQPTVVDLQAFEVGAHISIMHTYKQRASSHITSSQIREWLRPLSSTTRAERRSSTTSAMPGWGLVGSGG